MIPYLSEAPTAREAWMMGLKRRAQHHHCLASGCFPVELTALEAARRRYSRSVRPVTLQPFFIKAAALAIRATPDANRILFRRFPLGRKLVRFRSVDVNVPVTRDVDGEKITLIGTIRSADERSIAEIQDELAWIRRCPPDQSRHIGKLRRLERAPRLAVSAYHWLMSHSPSFYLRNAGTCGITTLDGLAGGCFFPVGPTTAVFGIGGPGDQVVARHGAAVVRRMLNVALTLDNYVINGGDGLALAQAFTELIESCSFVEQELGPRRPAGDSATPYPRSGAV